jgi:hypothetical protein
MRVHRPAIAPLALTVVNLVLLVFLLLLLLARGGAAEAQSVPPVVRARMFELVDARGTVRASLRVESDGDAAVVRLMDEYGTIRVKLAANADGSGLVLLDDRTELGVQIRAQQAGSSVKLVARDGGEQLLRP